MIQLEKVNYRYKDNEFLTIKDACLSIQKGELTVLTGRSGCGKSTIFRLINGLCPLFFEGEKSGNVYLDNKDISSLRICDISQIAASVFQTPENQFFTEDVLSDLVYACENYEINRQEIKQRLEEIVSMLSIDKMLGKKLSELSGGEKQKVAIAGALMLKTDILLLDEPSANLDYQSIILLAETLEKLKNSGYTILVIEHRLFYLEQLCDKLLVMEQGKISCIYEKSELSAMNNDRFHEIGLRGMHLFQSVVRDPPKEKLNKPLFEVKDITFRYKTGSDILNGISFSVFPGDKIALLGRNGCGKTTLAKLLCGLRKEQKGSISLNGEEVLPKSRSRTVSYVMQNVDFQFFGYSVYSDLLLGNEDVPDIENKIEKILSILHLADMKEQHPTTLSVGQKQRLVLAASYLQNKVLNVFDEPTSGLDYDSMQKVSDFIDAATGNSNASIIITHDYEFIVSVCNRVILLENGKIVKDFPLKDTEQLNFIFKENL